MVSRTFLLSCAGLILLCTLPAYSKVPQESASETPVLLNAYQAVVDEHLQGVLIGLKALAATEEVISGDWQRMRGPLTAFGKAVPTEAAIWFARPNGSYLTVDQGKTS